MNKERVWCLGLLSGLGGLPFVMKDMLGAPLPGSSVASGARLVFVKPAFGRLPF